MRKSYSLSTGAAKLIRYEFVVAKTVFDRTERDVSGEEGEKKGEPRNRERDREARSQ